MPRVKLKRVTEFCLECNGNGYNSECCFEYLDHNNKCCSCGKFSQKAYCGHCHGEGQLIYEIGSDITIFVSIYSEKYLKRLYKAKEMRDVRTFKGKIDEFIDQYTAWVRIEGRKKRIRVKLSDINLE